MTARVPPATPEGKPISDYDLALVRRTFAGTAWPVPNLVAEIDRLRQIEAAARAVLIADGIAESGTVGGDREWDIALAALAAALGDRDAAETLGEVVG